RRERTREVRGAHVRHVCHHRHIEIFGQPRLDVFAETTKAVGRQTLASDPPRAPGQRPRASRENSYDRTHHLVGIQPSRRLFSRERMPESRELLRQVRIAECFLAAKIDVRVYFLREFFHMPLWYHHTEALSLGLADKFAVYIRRREQQGAW